MANFLTSLEILKKLEFGNKSEKALHQNPTENFLTYMGINEQAHPKWIGWVVIRIVLGLYNNNFKKASINLYHSEVVNLAVADFYKLYYWDKMQLDRVKKQKIADELFIFGVNVGYKTAVKKAQKILKIKQDGIVGNITLKHLNNYDKNRFDFEFDKEEILYYSQLASFKPSLKIYLDGWKNRAEAV